MHHHISAFGLFHKPLVGHAVATVDKTQTVPFQTKANGAITNMNGRETACRSELENIDTILSLTCYKHESMNKTCQK
jgi:hypothetical protein